MKKLLFISIIILSMLFVSPLTAFVQEFPRFFSLSVPFTTQAPFENWIQPWQDFCEEASIVMAAHFVWDLPLTPEIAAFEMQLIKQYEIASWNRYQDTSIGETAEILRELYNIDTLELKPVTYVEDIKFELRKGHIVIIPFAGRMVHNPYFVPPGPRYHMAIIRGYDDDRNEFIVNEPGTRWGEAYRYNQDVLFNALHDLNVGEVEDGEKLMLVVSK